MTFYMQALKALGALYGFNRKNALHTLNLKDAPYDLVGESVSLFHEYRTKAIHLL